MSNFDFCQPFARLVQKKSKIMLGERENYRSIWTKHTYLTILGA